MDIAPGLDRFIMLTALAHNWFPFHLVTIDVLIHVVAIDCIVDVCGMSNYK